MDKRLQLVEALQNLSRDANRIATLLLEIDLPLRSNEDIGSIGDPPTTTSINVEEFSNWPEAEASIFVENPHKAAQQRLQSIGFDFADLRVFETSLGPNVPLAAVSGAKTDLITDSYKFSEPQPTTVRIIKDLTEASQDYDIGVIIESLEFSNNPAAVLTETRRLLKPDGKIILRVRPWTSRNGGFQSSYFNKAYAHLLTTLSDTHKIRFRATKPLANYETLIKNAGLTVITRKIHSESPEDFINAKAGILQLLCERTWSQIRSEEALKIISTSCIDYILT